MALVWTRKNNKLQAGVFEIEWKEHDVVLPHAVLYIVFRHKQRYLASFPSNDKWKTKITEKSSVKAAKAAANRLASRMLHATK